MVDMGVRLDYIYVDISLSFNSSITQNPIGS
jgi:hypothetical protein